MNKPIIIDGVDVYKCGYAKRRIYDRDIECQLGCDCSERPNCYYKRLQRLEQENKELKEVKEQLKKWNDENLKRQDNMQLWIDLAEKQRKDYRSVLEYINILAKNYCNACDEFKAKTYKNKNDCLYCNYGFIKRKINEVLKDE